MERGQLTCSSLPCDGWIDNAGWEINGEGHTFPRTISQFNATYLMPGLPTQLEAPPNCTFNYSSSDSCPGTAYFIGLENSDGWDRLNRWKNGSDGHGPLAHSILQPVVEYFDCPHPEDHTFCARSWCCCPFNVPFYWGLTSKTKGLEQPINGNRSCCCWKFLPILRLVD